MKEAFTLVIDWQLFIKACVVSTLLTSTILSGCSPVFRTKRSIVAIDCDLRAFCQPLPPAAFFSRTRERERGAWGGLFIDAEIIKQPDLYFIYHQIQI